MLLFKFSFSFFTLLWTKFFKFLITIRVLFLSKIVKQISPHNELLVEIKPFLSVFCLQQAINAAVAINHMKKLQMANTEQTLRRVSVPDIKVSDLSSPRKHSKHLDPDKPEPKKEDVNGNISETHHMSLPTSHVDLKIPFHPLKATQSQAPGHHAPSIAEQGKNVYHSEPANLNGYGSAPAILFISNV